MGVSVAKEERVGQGVDIKAGNSDMSILLGGRKRSIGPGYRMRCFLNVRKQAANSDDGMPALLKQLG